MTTASHLDAFVQKFKPTFFLSEEGEPMMSFESEEKGLITIKTNSEETRLHILKFLSIEGRKRSKDILSQLQEELTANAVVSLERRKVYLRQANIGEEISIDLNNSRGEIARIDRNGFKIIRNDKIHFIRTYSQKELPTPKETGDWVQRLNRFTNFSKEEDLILFIAFLAKTFFEGAFPILVLEGPQGSAKSSTSKLARMIIDPAAPSIVAPPRNIEDVLMESMKGFLLVFDNLSGITAEMSDIFCRVSTGGGLTKRTLYTNDSYKSHQLLRPIIINGIEEPTDRADFSERAIILNLKKIQAEARISEIEWEKELERELPFILFGFYNLLSDILNILPEVQKTNLPRMTEYSRVGIAIEKALDLQTGFFLEKYGHNLRQKEENAFFNDPLCLALKTIIESQRGDKQVRFNGSEELRQEVLKHISLDYRYSVFCPKSPGAFSARLKRLEPILLSQGIDIERLPRTQNHRPLILKLKEGSHTEKPVIKQNVYTTDDIPF